MFWWSISTSLHITFIEESMATRNHKCSDTKSEYVIGQLLSGNYLSIIEPMIVQRNNDKNDYSTTFDRFASWFNARNRICDNNCTRLFYPSLRSQYIRINGPIWWIIFHHTFVCVFQLNRLSLVSILIIRIATWFNVMEYNTRWISQRGHFK